MNMKKTIVSVLSISTLSFSLMGMASAKETADFTVNNNNICTSGLKTLDVISIQNYDLPMKVGQECSVYNAAATRYWTDNQRVASVNSFGIVTAHSRGDATITRYKGTSVLGQVFVRVW